MIRLSQQAWSFGLFLGSYIPALIELARTMIIGGGNAEPCCFDLQ